jgi:ribosomal-protein-alanine N-acetyltransferase
MTETLSTERLLLRPFVESDWQAVHAMISDPEVIRYVPAGSASEEETREHIQTLINGHEANPPRYNFAVVLRSEGVFIGMCFLAIGSRDDQPRQADLGYLLSRRYWGQGYATEAARAVLEFGFQELDLHRVYATCRPANVASSRVMEKLGMRREGHLRQHRWTKGEWQDSLLYAVLDHEWQALSNESDSGC